MITYNSTTIGEIVIKQKDRKFKLQIRQGNCLAVIIHVAKITEGEDKGKYKHTLYTFFADTAHMENIIKSGEGLFGDEIVSIKLNLYYKECYKLLKYFCIDGHKVTCYFKADK